MFGLGIVAFEYVKRRTLKPMADWVDLNSRITRSAPTDLARNQNIFWLRVYQRSSSFSKPNFLPRTARISIKANPASQKPRCYDTFSETYKQGRQYIRDRHNGIAR